jgi:hypothetical protein
VSKKITLNCICLAAALSALHMTSAFGQFAQLQAAQPQDARATGMPDDLHINLMIRNAIVALSQANATGNYSVLRDLGTPNFQIANSSARLAEVFATLRVKKVDLSPVIFFEPKFTSLPALQDGQVLRLMGLFATTPEQVNFDLAFQLAGDRWMLAGIAVSVTPPGEGAQISAAPSALTTADAKPGEVKPIKIDLSKPAQAQPAPAKKTAAPAKKPKPPTQKTAAAQPAASSPSTPAADAAPQAETEAKPAPAPKPTDSGSGWNPFAR